MTDAASVGSTSASPPQTESLLIPEYGRASLAEVVPSLLAAARAPGFANPLGVDPVDGICLLVIDGLGWEQLIEFRRNAPFLAAGLDHGRALTAGFPSTTATSLASLGTGLTPGEHGLTGLTVRIPGDDRALNLLRWEAYGDGPNADLRETVRPEEFQPSPTVLETARRNGVTVTLVGPPENVESGLTRAILRGGQYVGATTLTELVEAATDAAEASREPVFAYHPFLDSIGHMRGIGTPEWVSYLQLVDAAVETLRSRLPPGVVLAITSDHGMVNVDDENRLDLGDEPDLMKGVLVVAGEARARHLHVMEGARDDVLAAWTARLGDRAWVLTGEEAIEKGLFGPSVRDFVRPRIGDVVVAARGTAGVFQRQVDPVLAGLIAHHGSLTPAEQRVPMLLFEG